MIPISLTMMQNIAAPGRWSTAQSLQATDITSNMLNIPTSISALERSCPHPPGGGLVQRPRVQSHRINSTSAFSLRQRRRIASIGA
jgi:hypothetical protein